MRRSLSCLKKNLVYIVMMVQLLFVPSVYADNIQDDRFTDISVVREGQVLIVELASPPINGISVPVLTGINAVLDIALDTDAVKAIVITGQEALFSTGAGEISDGPAGLSHSAYAIETFNRMEAYPLPIVAAVNGPVGQGGNELAMAADFRVLGENAVVTQMEVQVGLIPGFGGMQRLPRIVGQSVAREMMLLGRLLTAEEAQALGYAVRVVPVKETVSSAIELANQMIETLGPTALKVYKERSFLSSNETFVDAQVNDHIAFDAMFGTDEFKAAFAKFQARMAEQK